MDIIQLEGEKLRQYQMTVLEIAKDFVKLCDKYNLQYSLSGGSILGAVRHKGFIPWDDDIDINITRKSYEKLISIFNLELGDKYFLQTPQNSPELGLMVTQIRKRRTVARRKYDIGLKECGVSIDLYILENVFDNVFLGCTQKYMSLGCNFAKSAIRTCKNYNIPHELILLEGRSLNYSRSKLMLGKFLKLIPLTKWIAWCNYWNSACKNENSIYVAIPTGRKHFPKEIYRREEMCRFRKEKFETEEFNIPVGSEKYLTRFYGDYMRLPPVEKRERHLFLELDF